MVTYANLVTKCIVFYCIIYHIKGWLSQLIGAKKAQFILNPHVKSFQNIWPLVILVYTELHPKCLIVINIHVNIFVLVPDIGTRKLTGMLVRVRVMESVPVTLPLGTRDLRVSRVPHPCLIFKIIIINNLK